MSETLKTEIAGRGITRLCHFTPSRNFGHIAAGGAVVLSTKKLTEDERAVFNASDLERLDGHLDHVCCSIEYPNAWYLSKAMGQERIFRDWLVLFLSPLLMLRKGTLFSPRNAAAGRGTNLRPGLDGFLRLYESRVTGARGITFTRTPAHLASAPPDQQAEVLIPDSITVGDILGIAVRDEEQVKNEIVRLRLIGVDAVRFTFVIAPTLFDKYSLDGHIRSGMRPKEVVYQTGDFSGE
jgi:hypothetical protein